MEGGESFEMKDGILMYPKITSIKPSWLVDGYNPVEVVHADGSTYEGEWKNGTRNGYGTFIYQSGLDKMGNPMKGNRYEGEWKDGEVEGSGTIRYNNGSQYKGEWKKGFVKGKGFFTAFIYGDGSRYDGELKDGKVHGKGVHQYINGDRYEGELKDGYRHGKGTFDHHDYRYYGEWENGKVEGKGIYYNKKNGVKYLQLYRNGKRMKQVPRGIPELYTKGDPKETIKVFVVSDMHINRHRAQENHNRDTGKGWENDAKTGVPQLISFIKLIMLYPNPEKILVLNGDIIDIWSFKVNKVPLADFSDERVYPEIAALKKLLEGEAKELMVVYVRGNHDARLTTKEVRNVFGCHTIVCDAVRIGDIWVEHGHRFDSYNCPLSWDNEEMVEQYWKDYPIGYFLTRIEASSRGPIAPSKVLAFLKASWPLENFLFSGKGKHDSGSAVTVQGLRTTIETNEAVIFAERGKTRKISDIIGMFQGYFASFRRKYPEDYSRMVEQLPTDHRVFLEILETFGLPRNDINVVAFGHSHTSEMKKILIETNNPFKVKETKVYLNTGEWVNGRANQQMNVFSMIDVNKNNHKTERCVLVHIKDYGEFNINNPELWRKASYKIASQEKPDYEGRYELKTKSPFVEQFMFAICEGSTPNWWYNEALIFPMKSEDELTSAPPFIKLNDATQDKVIQILGNDGLCRLNLEGLTRVNNRRFDRGHRQQLESMKLRREYPKMMKKDMEKRKQMN